MSLTLFTGNTVDFLKFLWVFFEGYLLQMGILTLILDCSRSARVVELQLRPYAPENTRSRLIPEVQPGVSVVSTEVGDHSGIPRAVVFVLPWFL